MLIPNSKPNQNHTSFCTAYMLNKIIVIDPKPMFGISLKKMLLCEILYKTTYPVFAIPRLRFLRGKFVDDDLKIIKYNKMKSSLFCNYTIKWKLASQGILFCRLDDRKKKGMSSDFQNYKKNTGQILIV